MIHKTSKHYYGCLCLVLALLICTFIQGKGQSSFQQDVQYTIKASLDNLHNLDAQCTIHYTNNSSSNIDTIFFHQWMNAFHSKQSEYANQLLRSNALESYFKSIDPSFGYRSISVHTDQKEYNIYHQGSNKEIGYIVLSNPLGRNESIQLEFNYSITLPPLHGRVGYDNDLVKLVHWYPRIAVFDQKGWHKMPYLQWGEYYGEYSDFRIELELPEDQTGIGLYGNQDNNLYHASAKKVIDYPIFIYSKSSTTKSVQHHDITIYSHFYHDSLIWNTSTEIAKKVIKYYENEIGPFPYEELHIVQGQKDGTSAMEYPGVIVINADQNIEQLQYYIAHEIAHQYFYAALGFNERQEAYLDEGLATFYERKYHYQILGKKYEHFQLPHFLDGTSSEHYISIFHHNQCCKRHHQSLNTPVVRQTLANYGINNYEKAPRMFGLIEAYLGEVLFRKCIKSFYKTYINKHISGKDLFQHIEKESGLSMQWVYPIINGDKIEFELKTLKDSFKVVSNSSLPTPLRFKYKPKSYLRALDTVVIVSNQEHFQINKTNTKHIELNPYAVYNECSYYNNHYGKNLSLGLLPKYSNHTNHRIFVLPFARYTTTDLFMPSLFISNHSIPTKDFAFSIAPSYTIKNKELRGQANISYKMFLDDTTPSFIQAFAAHKRFGFEYNQLFKYDRVYSKSSIGIRYISPNYKVFPRIKNKIELSYHYITEERAEFGLDGSYLGLENQPYTIIQLKHERRQNNGKSLSIWKNRANFLPKVDNQHHLRLETEYQYRSHYNSKHKYGLRLWAGYFLINSQRASLSYNNIFSKGSLGLIYSSRNDYTYEMLAIDRMDHSIAQTFSDGGQFYSHLKNSSLGQSNNFASALNLFCDIPLAFSKYVPLQVFINIGYYDQDYNDQELNLLYNAGLRLSFFDERIVLALPILNSDEINQVLNSQSKRLLDHITFSISLSDLTPFKAYDNINYYF